MYTFLITQGSPLKAEKKANLASVGKFLLLFCWMIVWSKIRIYNRRDIYFHFPFEMIVYVEGVGRGKI